MTSKPTTLKDHEDKEDKEIYKPYGSISNMKELTPQDAFKELFKLVTGRDFDTFLPSSSKVDKTLKSNSNRNNKVNSKKLKLRYKRNIPKFKNDFTKKWYAYQRSLRYRKNSKKFQSKINDPVTLHELLRLIPKIKKAFFITVTKNGTYDEDTFERDAKLIRSRLYALRHKLPPFLMKGVVAIQERLQFHFHILIVFFTESVTLEDIKEIFKEKFDDFDYIDVREVPVAEDKEDLKKHITRIVRYIESHEYTAKKYYFFSGRVKPPEVKFFPYCSKCAYKYDCPVIRELESGNYDINVDNRGLCPYYKKSNGYYQIGLDKFEKKRK